MRLFLASLAAVFLSAEAPPPDLQKFDRDIQASHFKDPAATIDRLIEQRTPKDGQPRPDALLNALIGRLLLASHHESPASTYLMHATLSELPAEIRAQTALARGRALEMEGDRPGAVQAYRDASGGGAASELRQATMGLARQLLATAPSEARDQLFGIATGPTAPDRWEARYLLSLASSLMGDRVSAARFADEAWADAAIAPPEHLAPLHVATLRAGLAAARQDHAAERAMLATTNGLSLAATSRMSSQLPVCGDEGVKPSDYVTFGIVTGPYYTRHLVPIAASRPEAVAPFFDRLAGFSLIERADSSAPVGTIVTLSCRSVVNPEFVSKPAGDDPLLNWFVQRGLYPAAATNRSEDESVNAIAARIDSLEARFGKQSILLIHPKWQLMSILEARARAGDQVLPGQLVDLRREVAAGLRRAAAPEWLAQTVESRTDYEQMVRTASDRSDLLSQSVTLLGKQLVNVPFETSRRFLTEMLGNFREDIPPPISRLVVDLGTRTPKTLGQRERQAWLLTLARAQTSLGKEREARATRESAELEKDLCAAADSEPKLLDQHFTYDDYPEELIAGEHEGVTMFEFAVAPNGQASSPRIVMSLPSGLFDEPSRKGIGTVRYTPAKRTGKVFPCRGELQSVVWRLEDQDDSWIPSLTPEVPAETT